MRLGDPANPSRNEIWAVGGGKGGTGKSFLSANLGIALSHRGKRVLLIDADLGCANLHTCLGIDYPEATLSDLLKGRIKRIEQAIVPTGIPNVGLISGAQDILEVANPKHAQKERLLRQIQGLDIEYIILDLGAGTSFNILDFFLIADQGILAVLPEPTSIENVYRFIKSVFYRRFRKVAKEDAVKEMIALAMDQKNEFGIKTPYDLIEQVARMDPGVGEQLKKEMYSLRPKLVVNQVRSKDDITLGFSMRSSCAKYFGITVEYVGYVEHDDHVWQATKRRRPLLTEYPASNAARGIEKVAAHLADHEQLTIDYLVGTALRR
ncbi:MAG: AAA family ATPase [Nitrospirae bacterium]|nr:AAA family ATPase [Nitrospirota bacterium]